MESAVEKQQEFIIDDLSKAEWTMKKIAHLKNKIADKQAQAAKMKADIDSWLLTETEHHTNDIAYFEGLLQPFVVEQLKDSKKKSISLPSGKIGFKAGNKNFMFAGKKVEKTLPELIKFIKETNPEFIETKETVKWGDLKKTLTVTDKGVVVTSDGEIVTDMTVEQGDPKFYIEVK